MLPAPDHTRLLSVTALPAGRITWSSRSTPSRKGRTASTTAAIRRGSSGSPGWRNSIIPATRNRPLSGVHATRWAGKYSGPRGMCSAGTLKL